MANWPDILKEWKNTDIYSGILNSRAFWLTQLWKLILNGKKAEFKKIQMHALLYIYNQNSLLVCWDNAGIELLLVPKYRGGWERHFKHKKFGVTALNFSGFGSKPLATSEQNEN